MSKFKCSGCAYESLRKESVKRHQINKNKCSEEVLTIVAIEHKIQCEFCSKLFSTAVSKFNHQKKCTDKSTVSELEKKVESLENLINRLIKEGESKVKAKSKPEKSDYVLIEEEDVLCEYSESKSIVPHSKSMIVNKFEVDRVDLDDLVEVDIHGNRGLEMEATIEYDQYIMLESDNTKKFYYKPQRGQLKAKDLKVHYVYYCPNPAKLQRHDGSKYCIECYNNHKSKILGNNKPFNILDFKGPTDDDSLSESNDSEI